ncbi:antitoxin Xre/MbcA/ParS toxin-binding domain-containing protein [Caballeronia sp. GACF5]|uniref:type II RES/Xre toxin-antitoxin system antitoxin n=1 Tax=Caballeronia sp. GACF5 TaxID=2921746 RepID=UPI0020280C7D|nr:antitoxin Xre/MbcA/ParS toxin-binding domain-containing protein [Caballeronia sp. GACF5]
MEIEMKRTVRDSETGKPFRSLVLAIQTRISSFGPYVSNGTSQFGDMARVVDMTPLQAHDVVTRGLPVALAREMIDEYGVVSREALLLAIGVSERTLQRGKDESRLLDSNATDRLLRLACITEQAIDVLGSKEAAERWLSQPAIGLDQRRPVELLQSSGGAELVKTLLTRMDYGVYS